MLAVIRLHLVSKSRHPRSRTITTLPSPPPSIRPLPPPPKPTGDISSIFPSLSGATTPPLPPRFATLKAQIIAGHEHALQVSWNRLLPALATEIDTISQQQSAVIPSIAFSSLSSRLSPATLAAIKHRGCVIIRNVLPQFLARDLRYSAQSYITANRSHIRAFPADDPAVYELYWSPAQVAARKHPNILSTQRFLQELWHSSSPTTRIATRYPLTYADRLRIRHPGDARFSLGPHIDGGSLERWEDPEYRAVYSRIFEGRWEDYDPYDAAHRVGAKMDLYAGAGACSMFRMFQGWLSLSSTGPGEGTLRLLPAVKEATAYFLLRPFFGADNQLTLPQNSQLQGAVPAAAQEFTIAMHRELRLGESMVSIPKVEPGDYVAWHCDMLHSVDKEHRGARDSSVLYIPATPLTEGNAKALKAQREAAVQGVPPGDFPSGVGEKGFQGAVQWEKEGVREMGMGGSGWEVVDGMGEGEEEAVRLGNMVMGWSGRMS